jgi:phosphoserine aminotransferase
MRDILLNNVFTMAENKDNRVYNFSAGPCTLPLDVLEEAQLELVDYHNLGMSLLEMSHRGPVFAPIYEQTRELALSLWGAPDDFDVLFLQGGASGQFPMVPMNLLDENSQGAYINTGHWVKVAMNNAQFSGHIYEAWSGEMEGFVRTPESGEIELKDNTRYVHLCSNETIGGLRYPAFPDLGVPIVADMSSEMLARAIPWEKFDIVFGGAQKNLGPAGVTLVYIRKSILDSLNTALPRVFSYAIQQANQSMTNTPPVFSIWMVNKVLRWIERKGGVGEMQHRATIRSQMLYDCIDASDNFYQCPINPAHRSQMNVVYTLPTPELEKAFLEQAEFHKLMHLRGHRIVGGIRASLYNAMPLEGVETLVNFMREFKDKNG